MKLSAELICQKNQDSCCEHSIVLALAPRRMDALKSTVSVTPLADTLVIHVRFATFFCAWHYIGGTAKRHPEHRTTCTITPAICSCFTKDFCFVFSAMLRFDRGGSIIVPAIRTHTRRFCGVETLNHS
jgi:hypothetical protein